VIPTFTPKEGKKTETGKKPFPPPLTDERQKEGKRKGPSGGLRKKRGGCRRGKVFVFVISGKMERRSDIPPGHPFTIALEGEARRKREGGGNTDVASVKEMEEKRKEGKEKALKPLPC